MLLLEEFEFEVELLSYVERYGVYVCGEVGVIFRGEVLWFYSC